MFSLAQQPTMMESGQQWNVGDCVTGLSWSPDSSRIVVSDAAGMVTVFEVETGLLVWSVVAHISGALQVEWCPDGGMITSAGQDGKVKFWDAESGAKLRVLVVSEKWVDRIAWAPDGQQLAASAGKILVVWDLGGDEVLRCGEHTSTITAIAWKHNSQEIATTCYKGVRLFRLGSSSEKPFRVLHCLGSLIALAWSPDGHSICAGSQDRVLQFWRLSAKKGGHAEMKGYPEKVSNIDWSSTGNYLASAGGNTAVVWKNKGKGPAGTTPKVLKGHRQRITQLKHQHKGLYLASGAQDGDILVWQLKKGVEPVVKWQMNSEITRLAWSPDDQFLIAGNKEGQVNRYSIAGK